MGFILDADCTVSDAFAAKNVTYPTEWFAEFCVYLPQSTLDAICFQFSADFVQYIGAGGGSDGIFITTQGQPPGQWAWWVDYTPSGPAGVVTPDAWHTIKAHYSSGNITWSVDGTVLFSYALGHNIVGAGSVELGGIFSSCEPAIYIDDFKLGTTAGGSGLFSDNFESGGLSAWDSTTGSVSVVSDTVTGGGCSGCDLGASFTANPSSGFAPLTVTFTDTSTGGPPTSWAWTFGDGGTSTLQNPTHLFVNPGSYTVTLTVTDAICSDSTSQTITTTAQPVIYLETKGGLRAAA